MSFTNDYEICRKCTGYDWKKPCYQRNPIQSYDPVCLWYQHDKRQEETMKRANQGLENKVEALK